MKAKHFIIAAAALIAALGLGLGWKDARAARAAESAVTITAHHRARVETDLRQMAERLAATEKERSALQSQLDELQKPMRPVAVATEPPAGAPDRGERLVRAMIEGMAQVREDPNAQNRQLAAQRIRMAAEYALFFRTLGLAPAQIEKFLDITSEYNALTQDLISAARAQGLSMNDPGLGKLGSQAYQKCSAAQRELLGKEGVQQLKDYERAIPTRNLVSRMAGAATVAGVPFTSQQTEQLVQVLANADSNYRRGGNASVRNIDWDAVETSARAILTEPQYAFFQLSNQRLARQYSDLLNRATKADAASTAAPAAK
jgi:hypothetical protein